jgi:hypothetical protein
MKVYRKDNSDFRERLLSHYLDKLLNMISSILSAGSRVLLTT